MQLKVSRCAVLAGALTLFLGTAFPAAAFATEGEPSNSEGLATQAIVEEWNEGALGSEPEGESTEIDESAVSPVGPVDGNAPVNDMPASDVESDNDDSGDAVSDAQPQPEATVDSGDTVSDAQPQPEATVDSGDAVSDAQPQPEASADSAAVELQSQADDATVQPQAVEPTTEEPVYEASAEPVDEKRNIKDGTYTFGVALKKNMVLDVTGNSSKAGANVQLYTSTGSTAQRWTIKYIADGIYNIFKYGTQMALSVAGNKTTNGTNVELAKLSGKNGSKGQQWKFVDQGNGFYSLISALKPTLALDVYRAKAADKQNVQVYRKNNSDAQKFKLYEVKTAGKSTLALANGTYTVRPVGNTTFGLDVKAASKANGANIQLYKANTSQAQKLHFESDGNGYYIVTVIGSGKVLSVKNASVIPGNNVQQATYTGANTQKWALHETANGVEIVNKATNLALDIAGAKYASGANIQVYKRNNSAAQKYKLSKTATLKQGIYSISSFKATGSMIDVKGNSTKNGAVVQLLKSNNELGQRFEIINISADGKELYRIRTAASGGFLTYASDKVTQYGNHATAENDANTWELVWNGTYFSLRNVAQKKVLDLKGAKTANGTVVQVYRANATDAQHFFFNPANLVVGGAYILTSKVDTRGNLVLNANGYNVQIASKNGGETQRFVLKATGNTSNTYTLTNTKHGKMVGVSSTANMANVSLGAKNQQWVAAIGDGGYVTFVNKASGKVLAVDHGTAKSGTNVWQYNPKGSAAQQWKLTRAIGWDLSSGKYVFYDAAGKRTVCDKYCYKAWNKIKNMTSGTKYIAAVDLTNCYTNIYEKQGSIWAPLHSWVCSVGNRSAGAGTPVGTFTMNGVKTRLTLIEKEEVSYRWGVHYWSVFYPRNQWGGGTGFHSYIYLNDTNYLLDGREQMHITGSCVRLSKPRAQWIYEHLNKGTRVHTYYE